MRTVETETYRGFSIIDFGHYLLVMEEGEVDYEQEPFGSVQDARAKIDRHLKFFPLIQSFDIAYSDESVVGSLMALKTHQGRSCLGSPLVLACRPIP